MCVPNDKGRKLCEIRSFAFQNLFRVCCKSQYNVLGSTYTPLPRISGNVYSPCSWKLLKLW